MSIPKSVKDQQDYTNIQRPGIPSNADLGFQDNPGIGISDYLFGLRKNPLPGTTGYTFSLASPFTRFLLNSKLADTGLNTLFDLVTPDAANAGPSAFANFGHQIIDSLYNTNTAAPGNLNLGDRNLGGQLIYDFLNGTGTAGQGAAHENLSSMIDTDVLGELNNIIDVSGTFTMSDLQKTVAKNQLLEMHGQWANSALANTMSFGDYVLARSADWLNKWWHITTAPKPAPAPTPAPKPSPVDVPYPNGAGGNGAGATVGYTPQG